MSANSRAVEWLKSERNVRRLVQWHLFVLRVYMPTKRHYERQYETKAIQQVADTEGDTEGDNEGYQEDEDVDGREVEEVEDYLGYGNNKTDRKFIASSSNMCTFPSLSWVLRIYNIVTASILSWVVLKYLFPVVFAHISRFIYIKLSGREHDPQQLPLSCFNFGRLVVHYELTDELFGCLLSGFYVSWHLAQLILWRPYLLNACLFVLQPREDIERFIIKFNYNTSLLQQYHLHRSRPVGGGNWSPFVNGHLFGSSDKSSGLLSARERLLRDIMCFRVPYGRPDHCGDGNDRRRVLYRLRPNRSLEAYDKLVEGLATIAVNASIVFSLVTVFFASYIMFVVVFNQHRYIINYPECNPQMSQLFRRGKLERWSTEVVSQGGHALAVAIIDYFENFWVWFEAGVAIFWDLTFVMYLNNDLLNYWLALDKRIQRLSRKARRIYPKYSSSYNTNHHHHHFGFVKEFSDEIYHLQMELSDFFNQIQQVDMLVSDLITHSTLIWLTVFGTLSFKSVEMYSHTRNLEFVLVLLSVTLVVFVCYTSVCQSLMHLQRCCRRSYLAICSLMAHDQSRHKDRFIQIINYYTCANRTCYTLFQSYPFTNSNYLSVIGWSITAFLVLDSIYYRRIG